MAPLAVFDFDRTIVNDDSDATIINRLREKQPPPEWEASNHDWTPYMSEVFEHAYTAGLDQADILSSIASMRATPGIEELFRALHAEGWEILVLTDANSVFVQHWLSEHGMEKYVSTIITNGAWWRGGRLFIEPCMTQTACSRCPTNLCKSLALAAYGGNRDAIVYVGDGRNDYCPATNIPSHGIVFPRKGYPMDDLIKKNSSENPLKAKVVPWEDCYRILQELFPDKAKLISV